MTSPAQEPVFRFEHEAMNTKFELFLVEHDETYARSVAQMAVREIDRIEGLLSRFDPASDIAQINRLAAGTSVRVGLEAFECLQLAAKIHVDTGGALDVTVGPLMNCVRNPNATETERTAARALVGMSRIVFNAEQFAIGVTAPVEVDLGAIGKGYTLDKLAELLAEWGIKRALLNAGTSTVLAIGANWPVGIGGDWGRGAGIEAVALTNEALSGSGTEVQGKHILDPRTALPAEHHLATWAIAPGGALSDGLSTAFMVMTTDEVKKYCAAHPAVSALVIGRRRGVMRLFKDKVIATAGINSRKVSATKSE